LSLAVCFSGFSRRTDRWMSLLELKVERRVNRSTL
jgi:hypothetical protein